MKLERTKDNAGRLGTLLANDNIRVIIDDQGAMVPELSIKREAGYLNTHLIPPFRGNGGLFNRKKHKDLGAVGYNLAGNFPCFPQFGNPSTDRGYEIPGCGHTANLMWNIDQAIQTEEYVGLVSSLDKKKCANIEYKKVDIVLADSNVHYQAIIMTNHRKDDFIYGGAWHNTTGQPFIETGCKISAVADKFMTPIVSHDPDQNEHLKLNTVFDSLKEAPAADGSTIDVSVVPGVNGYTDFFTGRVPKTASPGWMGIVNPHQNAMYLTFYKGQNEINPENEFTFGFNHFWLQYGGRNYAPFARHEGGTDQAVAVGIESAVSHFGYGLDYSAKNPTLLDNPTQLTLKPGQTVTQLQGTMVNLFDKDTLESGIKTVEHSTDGLKVTSETGKETVFACDSKFERVEQIIADLLS